MAATIKTNPADNSQEPIDALPARLRDGGEAAEAFEADVAALNRELSSRATGVAVEEMNAFTDGCQHARDAVRTLADVQTVLQGNTSHLQVRFKALNDEVAGTAHQLDGYRSAIKQAAEVSESLGQSISHTVDSLNDKLQSLQDGASQLSGTFTQIVQASQMAFQAISRLTETAAQFTELQASIDRFSESADTVVKRFASTDFGAAGIEKATARLDQMEQSLQSLCTLAHSTGTEIDASLDIELSAHRQALNAIQDENAAFEAKLALAKQVSSQAVADQKAEDDRQSQSGQADRERRAGIEQETAERITLAKREVSANADLTATPVAQQTGDAAGLILAQTPQAFADQHREDDRPAKRNSRQLASQVGRVSDPEETQAPDASNTQHDFNMNRLGTDDRQAGHQARLRGFRDVVTGTASSEDLSEAQQNLANSVINQGQSTGRLNRSMAETLREATRVLANQQGEQRAIAQDLEQTKQILQQLLERGAPKSRNQARH